MARVLREPCNTTEEQALPSIANAMRSLNGEGQAVSDTHRERGRRPSERADD
ncbi:hypothetical protein [Halostagnicola larsenii]|uniref:hypothetical protein n=1 Tax=Halostagnicola larsenii TaxID=353800 RepID=UPI00146FA082|nr:hypothetical protein [Halostagnicola larsenii]